MREIDQKLHRYISIGRTRAVEQCLAGGADPNVEDESGHTPLMASVSVPQRKLYAQPAIVAALVAAGADTSAVTKKQPATAEDLLIKRINEMERQGISYYRADNKLKWRLLAIWQELRKAEQQRLLLLLDPSRGLRDKHGQTGMHIAARRGDLKVIRKGLARFAEVEICDDEGYTPTLRAAEAGNAEALHLLIPADTQWATRRNKLLKGIAWLSVRSRSLATLQVVINAAQQSERLKHAVFFDSGIWAFYSAISDNQHAMLAAMLDLIDFDYERVPDLMSHAIGHEKVTAFQLIATHSSTDGKYFDMDTEWGQKLLNEASAALSPPMVRIVLERSEELTEPAYNAALDTARQALAEKEKTTDDNLQFRQAFAQVQELLSAHLFLRPLEALGSNSDHKASA